MSIFELEFIEDVFLNVEDFEIIAKVNVQSTCALISKKSAILVNASAISEHDEKN